MIKNQHIIHSNKLTDALSFVLCALCSRHLSAFCFLLSALIGISSCSSDDRIPEQSGIVPIAFNISTANQTRAEATLDNYVKDFRVFCVYGNETAGTFTPVNTDLMTNWVVWYDEKTSSNTSATNTKSWEYVGSYTGSTSDATMSNISGGTSSQQIRYWDDNQSHYLFWALAKADRGTFTYNESAKTVTTTLDFSDPASAFYANPVVVAKADYGNAVKLVFHRLLAQVRVGFYETIPGYVVKDVVFYAAKDAASANSDEVILLGTYAFTTTTTGTTATITSTCTTSPTTEISFNGTSENTTQSFGALSYASDVQENLITAGTYLNLSSTAPTYATSTKYMIPGNAGPITIKCDYTLVANDHASDNEEIHVTGATATVPSEYCNWSSNYVYTYVFKISEKTNGDTGAGYAGLYPITFDAEASTVTEQSEEYTIPTSK